MSVIFLLIIFSLLLALGFLAAFIWSVKDGQYEDDFTPSVRILFEDEPDAANHSNSTTTTKENV
jgi:cbb3-type cytochrome oxidase maturation protein